MVFFFNDTATTEIYTLSLHDALPIFVTNLTLQGAVAQYGRGMVEDVSAQLVDRFAECLKAELSQPENGGPPREKPAPRPDRKSTRLNSSHANISYAVFCLTKINNTVQ